MKLKTTLRSAFVLFLICVITAAALAGVNLLTKDTVAQQTLLHEEATRQIVLPQAASFQAENGHYLGKAKDGSIIGYVFMTESSGYGGKIQVMTGISSTGIVTGVSVLDQTETVGLGANIEKEDFTSQYEQPFPVDGFTVTKSTPAEGEIAALTGATVSSNAVTKAVNEAIVLYQELEGDK